MIILGTGEEYNLYSKKEVICSGCNKSYFLPTNCEKVTDGPRLVRKVNITIFCSTCGIAITN